MFAPTYCTRCRKPIPSDVSRQQGICDACKTILEQEAARKAAAEAENAHRQMQEEERRHAEWFRRDTGKGKCPACQSTNISDIRHVQDDRIGKRAWVCCYGCGCFLPLLLLLPFVGSRWVSFSRRCNVCGHQWPI